MIRMPFISFSSLFTLVAALSLAGSIHAATLLSPTAVLGTDLGTASPDTPLVNMINQSGLDKPFTSGVTDFDTYFSSQPPAFAQAAGQNNWQSNVDFTLPLTGYVDFDFGEVYTIDRLALWNLSVKDIRVLVSSTTPTAFQEVASFSLPSHLAFFFSYGHDLLNLGAAHDVRYLRLQIDSVHLFDPSDTFGYAIVGELAASALPASTGLTGDYNDNQAVDVADYVVWRKHLGTSFNMPNDNSPNDVGLVDYDEWMKNFAQTPSGLLAVSILPEPTTGFLLCNASVLCLAVFRNKLKPGE